MKTAVKKRSIYIDGQKTSISLERDFYEGLLEIAEYEKISTTELIAQIDANRTTCNLSSAVRMFVFRYFRTHAGKGRVISLPTVFRTQQIRSKVLRALAR